MEDMRPIFLFFALAAISVQAQQPETTEPLPSAAIVTGAINFRDIGGLRTSDGRIVRSGIYFRSAELSHLTASDFDALTTLHIRYVFDLRTEGERSAAPTRWEGVQPEIVISPVGFKTGKDPADALKAMLAQGVDPDHMRLAMQQLTVSIAMDGAPEIAAVLKRLAHGDEPAIIHCSAGKDRTGVVTAVLLTILGVPRDAVLQDYERSNAAVDAEISLMKRSLASSGQPDSKEGGSRESAQAEARAKAFSSLPPASIRVLMGVDRSYLQAAFSAMDARYGSFDAYVHDALGLTDKDIESLRGRFLRWNDAHAQGASQ